MLFSPAVFSGIILIFHGKEQSGTMPFTQAPMLRYREGETLPVRSKADGNTVRPAAVHADDTLAPVAAFTGVCEVKNG